MCVSIQGHSSNGNYNQKTLWRFLHWIIASVTLRHRHAWVFQSMILILNILNNFGLLKHLDSGIGCLIFHEMTLRHCSTKVISVLRLSKAGVLLLAAVPTTRAATALLTCCWCHNFCVRKSQIWAKSHDRPLPPYCIELTKVQVFEL